jgi:hypothetical protein
MSRKLSPRVYELAVEEVYDQLFDLICSGGYEHDYVRDHAAKIVDIVTNLIYSGNKLDKPVVTNDRSHCPVCHGATCFHWSEGVDLPGCLCYPEKDDDRECGSDREGTSTPD